MYPRVFFESSKSFNNQSLGTCSSTVFLVVWRLLPDLMLLSLAFFSMRVCASSKAGRLEDVVEDLS